MQDNVGCPPCPPPPPQRGQSPRAVGLRYGASGVVAVGPECGRGPTSARPRWMPCVRCIGLMPVALLARADVKLLDEFLHRFYGMNLAVLAARMAGGRLEWPGLGDRLFLRGLG